MTELLKEMNPDVAGISVAEVAVLIIMWLSNACCVVVKWLLRETNSPQSTDSLLDDSPDFFSHFQLVIVMAHSLRCLPSQISFFSIFHTFQ